MRSVIRIQLNLIYRSAPISWLFSYTYRFGPCVCECVCMHASVLVFQIVIEAVEVFGYDLLEFLEVFVFVIIISFICRLFVYSGVTAGRSEEVCLRCFFGNGLQSSECWVLKSIVPLMLYLTTYKKIHINSLHKIQNLYFWEALYNL